MRIYKFLFVLILVHSFTCSWAVENSIETDDAEEPNTPENIKELPKLSLKRAMFFAIGKPDTKVQFSFKYRLFNTIPFHFALKEEIFWDLFNESRPFSNVQYSPEAFYSIYFNDSHLNIIDLGFFRHTSNGKGGDQSRSFNQSFLRILNKVKYEKTLLMWGGQIYGYYSIDPNNTDIVRYRGLYSVEFSLSNLFFENYYDSEIKFQFRSAGPYGIHPLLGNKILTYQFRPFSHHFSPALFVQTSYGYSESILFYNKTEFTVRAGVSLFEEYAD